MKAAIYIRVSTEQQADEGYSLAAQERTLREYCRFKDYEIFDIYADEGKSGKDIVHRPQLQRLISDGLAEKFHTIIVWKITRFTRSISDLCSTCDRLEKHDVYLESYSEGFDSRTPVGRMVRNILGVIAQWERETISENVRAAMRERALQGKHTFSYVLGYDVKKGEDELKVNAEEAAIVRFIFDSYIKYENLIAVADICNAKGYTGKRGKPFNPESIHRILTRPIYAGWYSWQGLPVTKGDYEALITEAEYNRIQNILKKRGIRFGRSRKTPLIKLPPRL
jgi:site-specific DNA recombinase